MASTLFLFGFWRQIWSCLAPYFLSTVCQSCCLIMAGPGVNLPRRCSNMPSCVCWSCYDDRLRQHDNKTDVQLLAELEDGRREVENSLDHTFAVRLNQCARAKRFKTYVLDVHHYRYLASYFRWFYQMDQAAAKREAAPINQKARVYDKLGVIVKNLESCPHVDIRSLSINQLEEAISQNWCQLRNSASRPRTTQQPQQGQGVANPNPFQTQEYRDLVDSVVNSQFYRNINRGAANSYGRHEKADFLSRLSKDVMAHR